MRVPEVVAAGVRAELLTALWRSGRRGRRTCCCKDQLLAIERRLWTNDAAFYGANLAEEALLVFSETGVITRDVAVAEIRASSVYVRRGGDWKLIFHQQTPTAANRVPEV